MSPVQPGVDGQQPLHGFVGRPPRQLTDGWLSRRGCYVHIKLMSLMCVAVTLVLAYSLVKIAGTVLMATVNDVDGVGVAAGTGALASAAS